MKPSPLNLRKLFRYLSLRSSLLSSSFSSQTHSIQAVNPQKPIFRSPENADPFINRSGRDSKFKETVDQLCQQKRLKDVIQLLENQVHQPSAALLTTILQLCIEKRALDEGRRVHTHIKGSGFVPGPFISNKILDLYCKCGSILDAQKLFDEMGDRDLCSWNTLISGYAKLGRVLEARKLFDEMPKRDNFSWTAMISAYVKHKQPANALELYRVMQKNEIFMCNKFTVSSALAASAAMQSLRLGKEIHGHIMRTGLDSDAVVWSALLDVYGKCGSLNEARYIFDRTLGKDTVSWTTMIDRYFGDGKWEEGLTLFSDFLSSGIRPNEFTFAGVLNACAHQTAEELGRQVHGHMMRTGFDPLSFAASALVHMYTKCGSVERAHKNGQPHEALKLFDSLLQSGNQPDHITFIGVLSACTHAGLVDKGVEYFHSIKEKHGLSHTADHYACVVDLLSRSGRFREAKDIINKMPIKPDKFLWASLLGKWSEVAKIRKLMDERGVVKKPGMSWIDVKKKVHIFLVGDQSHLRSNEIFEFLGKVSKRMKEEGYVPHTNYVLHDVEEEQKEQNLFYHSEKLVAFGIISTPPGSPIKVFKNLRTCVDCHTAIKFISSIAERKIIVGIRVGFIVLNLEGVRAMIIGDSLCYFPALCLEQNESIQFAGLLFWAVLDFWDHHNYSYSGTKASLSYTDGYDYLRLEHLGVYTDGTKSWVLWKLSLPWVKNLGLQFVLSKRQANERAHVLARATHSYASPFVWVEVSSWIGASLNNVCNLIDRY
ncbi:hypothetical protein DH2020_037597 [Rehmannia glutinosa]|uniref:DYW domain-containing protein n=1 Tax=Rehmannia glutinosa TaxID=99300 RepID=A0ABR0V3P3_REHGL